MSMRRNAARVALGAGVLLTACVSDEPDESTSEEAADAPTISVTVPPERLTPFCAAMIELTDEVRSGSASDANELIIETYRSIRPEVPPEIAADFDAVLGALEAGLPPPTDPPLPTSPTTPPTTASTTTSAAPTTDDESEPAGTTASGPTIAADGSVDEGFAPGNSPAERINSYVAFACRDTENNPGPPPTEPLGDAVDEDAG